MNPQPGANKKDKRMPDPKECKGISKWVLDTLYLVMAKDILEENIQAMQAYAAALGKTLVPMKERANARKTPECR